MGSDNYRLNGIELPERIIDKLNEATGYFGDTLSDMVVNSINKNLENLSINEKKSIEESLILSSNINALLESGQDTINQAKSEQGGSIFKIEENSYSFFAKLREANPNYAQKLNNVKILSENEEQEQPTQTDSIEGDGDTPEIDGQDPTKEQELTPEEQEAQMRQQLAPEEQLQLELAQTDSKFVTTYVYDKIVELLGSIKTIKETMSSSKSEMELDVYTTLEKYESYLEILNELIFVMDINTIYYNVVNIIIEVNDLLNKYLISTKIKVINNKKSTKDEKNSALDDLRDNNDNEEEINDEIDDMDMNPDLSDN